MKNPKNSANLIAQLRKTIGKSQSQFAAMVGVSKHTIISVENGRNQLSRKLAKLIKAATGADILGDHIEFEPVYDIPHLEPRPKLSPEQLSFMRRRHDGTGNREHVYTRQDFERWRAEYYPCNDETARKHYEKIKIWIEYIFRAAARPGVAGVRDRFPAVYQSLVDWLNEARSNFKLEKEIDELLESEPHTFGEIGLFLPLQLHDNHKKLLVDSGFDYEKLKKFSKRGKPSDCLILQTELRRGWDPFRGIEQIPCKTRKLAPKPQYWLEDWGAVFKRNQKKHPEIFSDDPEL